MAHIKQFEHLKIPLEAIISATNNFEDESCIGEGGFGKVYKAQLDHSEGKMMVALKRLDRRHGQGDSEFWKEIMMLSLYKHENVVSLLGYCDCREKILVYEYIPKRSLDLYLTSRELTWVRRLRVCIGAAHGLAYLHSANETQERVLHRDIKSSNILLDEEWNAKIADFGLSKFGPANEKYSFLFSNAVGTIGYIDPLYAETGLLTKESDVYSFGVVLFEVLCGRLCMTKNKKHLPLVGLARHCYEQNTINEIIYDNIKDQIDPDSLNVFTKIAYQCLKRDREDRPSMTDILRELENALRCQERIKDPDVNMNFFGKSRKVFESGHANPDGINEYDFKRGGLLVVTIHEGNDLKAKHPFVILRVGQDIRRTTTMKHNQNPVWKETFRFILDKPLANTVLHLVVCSGSWMNKEILGDVVDINLVDVINEKHLDEIYHLRNGRIHVEIQWEPSALPLKTKPKFLQFMSSVYHLTSGSQDV